MLDVHEAAPFAIRDRFRIYPNPATDALMIDDILHAVTAASVYDMQGRLAQQAPVSANPARLSLKALPAGTYMLRLQLKDGSSHSQLFIRRE